MSAESMLIDMASEPYAGTEWEHLFTYTISNRAAPEMIYVNVQGAAEAFYSSAVVGQRLELPPSRSPFNAATLAWEVSRNWPEERGSRYLDRALRYRLFPLKNGAEALSGTVYVWRKSGVVPIGQLLALPDATGMLSLDRPVFRFTKLVDDWAKSNEAMDVQRAKGVTSEITTASLFSTIVAPALYALAVLNCKNIILPGQAVSRPMRRRLGFHLVIRRLEVKPSTRHETSALGAGHPGVARHYCRGHFRDYTTGNGLFGKYHGVYWTPPSWKGRAESGVVYKSYAVASPEGRR